MFSKTKNEVVSLKGKKEIELLFAQGKHFGKAPLKLVCASGTDALALGFGVSKRNFPRAVDRNRIKRLMREQFKLQRANADYTIFYGKGFFIYTGNVLPSLHDLEKPMSELIRRWRSLAEVS
ncbi:MAG: ribonuclease P protein component [Flavobacteriaceae bacterium]